MTSQSSQGSASIQQGLEASYEHSTINVGMRSGARCINVSGLCWSMFAGGHPNTEPHRWQDPRKSWCRDCTWEHSSQNASSAYT